jgi:hypothetical protein
MQWDAHCGVLGQKDVLAGFAGQLCKTSMLLPAKGVTRLPRQFLLRGGFGGSFKGPFPFVILS